MIVSLAYEEIASVREGAELALEPAPTGGAVAAPPEELAYAETLRSTEGEISLTTLAEQRAAQRALELILAAARERMDALVLAQNVGSDDSVNAYFDYAHVLTVLDRVRGAGRNMSAIIELLTGRPPTPASAADITFPD
ncbi:MAG: hypothetical protein ABFS34_15750 [Gemmatimonadota bacterium]